MNERLTTFQVSCFLNKERPVHTKLDNYEDDYFSLKPMQNNMLFITVAHCSFVACWFKCSSSLISDGFWLAIDVFIIYKLGQIALEVRFSFYNNYLLFLVIIIIIGFGVNRY